WSRMRFGPSPPLTSRPPRSTRRHSTQPLSEAPTLAGGRVRSLIVGRGLRLATANSSSRVGVLMDPHPQSRCCINAVLQTPNDRVDRVNDLVAFDQHEEIHAILEAPHDRVYALDDLTAGDDGVEQHAVLQWPHHGVDG